MGLKSSENTSTTNASSTPWANAMPTVDNLFSLVNGQMGNTGVTSPEAQAIQNMTARGQAGNQFTAPVSNAATDMLNGGGATNENGNLTDNLTQYKNLMSMYTDPAYSTVNSAPVKAALDAINTNTTNSQNAAAAAAGRSGSGLSAKALSQAIGSAEAPMILNQANLDTGNRVNAINGVYNAGNTTSGMLTNNNTTANANKVTGTTLAGQATNFANQGDQQVLQAQELLKTIPQSAISTLAGLGIPLAQLGRNTTSHTESESTPSTLDAITKAAGMFSGGANSAISGLTNFGSGAMSGAGSLLSLLGL